MLHVEYLPLDPSLCNEGNQVYQDMSKIEERLFVKREECRKTMLDLELKQRRQELESFVSVVDFVRRVSEYMWS